MNPDVRRYVEAVSGFTNLTAARAESVAKSLVRAGEAASDQVGDVVDDLMARQRKNRDAVAKLVKKESERAVQAMGLASRKEVTKLEAQVARLEREISRLTGRSDSPPTKSAAKKTAAKKSAAKKTAAKKSAAKKTAAKKSAAKKTAEKKASKRAKS